MAEVGTAVDDIDACVASWLANFESSLNGREASQTAVLFAENAAWRDILAFTGNLRTLHGRGSIEDALKVSVEREDRFAFRISETVSVEHNERTGRPALEVVFRFDTAIGHGDGVVRLIQDESGELRAWTLLTALSELRHDLTRKPNARPSEQAYEGADRRNWLDYREIEASYADRDPDVLIVGAGQCGLALAARLQQAGVDALVVDKHERVGDNWRKRYHMLRLHNEKGSNHLPYMPFPENWPTYIPKDKLGDWLECYAQSMELNVWTGTSCDAGSFDPETRRWGVTVSRGGRRRTLRPKHLVLAVGVSGAAKWPAIPGLEEFSGPIVHSSDYTNGARFRGERVLVVGSGVSGHDIAQDLYWHGASVAMLQRSKTIVASLRPGAEKVYAHYRSTAPLDELDLLNISVPYPVKRERARRLTEEISQLDSELIEGLNRVGFRTHTGSDGTGFQMQFLRAGGGYYIDVGCSQLIAERKIDVINAHSTAGFDAEGLVFNDGSRQPFDALVLATGYQPVSDTVSDLLGSAVADAIGPVWGLDDEGELRNICRPTAQDGLWLIAGGLAEARIFSRFLALQLTAEVSGIRLAGRR
ncbi:flavin-containing monooxygenase [Streptomyces rhizosphaericus]|uniref:NAD(P)/FAD-dependent oxidoreductase n=1 Tax=Streptomyces rhizosphaericus TaxID=114699 RepID=A0A6G4A7T5_9ACTN|nr:NAD(P)/FAD-dependent oxidoreductase [Streptomyces rhizosphaericus]NEW69258.1 NAD(P)/FAD-dependent oxidoreductase [Streptomyces rhizosphaericus]